MITKHDFILRGSCFCEKNGTPLLLLTIIIIRKFKFFVARYFVATQLALQLQSRQMNSNVSSVD